MKGSYVLLVRLPLDTEIAIGNHLKTRFPKGYYAYVGSAMGGLKARLGRHLKRDKKPHWHIDYLTQHASVAKILFSDSQKNVECVLARYLHNVATKFASYLRLKYKKIPRYKHRDISLAMLAIG